MTEVRARPELVPPELLDRVVRFFDPELVILFGSRARGDAGAVKSRRIERPTRMARAAVGERGGADLHRFCRRFARSNRGWGQKPRDRKRLCVVTKRREE
jgi:hypothetical protein